MHIGFLTPEYPSRQQPDGGLGNYIRKTAKELLTRGHDVTIFLLSDRNDMAFDNEIRLISFKKKDHPGIISKLGYKFKLGDLGFITRASNAKRAKELVIKFHHQNHLDILQVSNYAYLGLYLCPNDKIPVICRISSYGPLLRTAKGSKSNFSTVMDDWFEWRQIQNAEAVFAPSQLLQRTISRFVGVKPEIIRSPIDTKILTKPIVEGKLEGLPKKYFLYFGTLNRIKGVDILLESAVSILERYGDIHFLFIGRNEPFPESLTAVDLMRKKLWKYIDQNRVIYLNPLLKEALLPHIKNAYGVIFPSRVDNYPNACLEALSLGVPVIGTKESSLDEMIIEGETGFLAENEDVESLISAMEKLINQDKAERHRMVQNIHNWIQTAIQEDRISDLLDFYQKISAKNRQAK